eukprot:s2547_g7.t1
MSTVQEEGGRDRASYFYIAGVTANGGLQFSSLADTAETRSRAGAVAAGLFLKDRRMNPCEEASPNDGPRVKKVPWRWTAGSSVQVPWIPVRRWQVVPPARPRKNVERAGLWDAFSEPLTRRKIGHTCF